MSDFDQTESFPVHKADDFLIDLVKVCYQTAYMIMEIIAVTDCRTFDDEFETEPFG